MKCTMLVVCGKPLRYQNEVRTCRECYLDGVNDETK